jgi:acetyl-CoA decarbonylase/synthase complex subunit gamma
MGLTAMEIFKMLPKTNCGDCGVPTCLAFAMQIAQMKAEIDKCPHVADDAKSKLSESAAPPIKLVKVGTGDNVVEMGDEVVLFRHEKTFYHPTAFTGMVQDTDDDLEAKVDKFAAIEYERIGMIMKMNMVAVKNASGDAGKFAEAVKKVKGKTSMPVVLMSTDPAAIEAALKEVGDARPLIFGANKDNFDAMMKIAIEKKLPLVISEEGGLEALGGLCEKAKKAGVGEIVMNFGKQPMGTAIQHLTALRRFSIKKGNRTFGFPIIMNVEDNESAPMLGALGVMKYASAIIFENADPAVIYPLMTLRQNIYTDPQKPIQVKKDIYNVAGEPGADAPLMFTTNFSLTYFTVEGDIEKSKIPSRIMVLDTDGLSVMTAFAAGKLTPEMVKDGIDEFKLEEKVPSKTIIIPGMVARMKGKLEDVSGWKVIVGPRDSAGIPKFLREL